MINEEWGEKNPQNDAGPLSPFTTCVLTRLFCQMKCQMCRSRECSSLFLYPDYITRGLTGSDSRSKPYLHRGEKRFGTRNTNLLQSYELGGKRSLDSHFSRLLRHAIEKGRGPILYTKKKRDPTELGCIGV